MQLSPREKIEYCFKIFKFEGEKLFNIKFNREVIGSIDNGYVRVGFRYNGIRYTVKYHRLVAYKLFGDDIFQEGIQVRHLDGNSLDNSFKNISIGTALENARDKSKETTLRAALIASSFVRKFDKLEVRDYYSKCKSYKKTMNHFNITSKGTLWFILNK